MIAGAGSLGHPTCESVLIYSNSNYFDGRLGSRSQGCDDGPSSESVGTYFDIAQHFASI